MSTAERGLGGGGSEAPWENGSEEVRGGERVVSEENSSWETLVAETF